METNNVTFIQRSLDKKPHIDEIFVKQCTFKKKNSNTLTTFMRNWGLPSKYGDITHTILMSLIIIIITLIISIKLNSIIFLTIIYKYEICCGRVKNKMKTVLNSL